MEKHWTVNYLQHILETRDWSMNQLAERAGLAASTINRPLRTQDYSLALSARTVAKLHAASEIAPDPFMPAAMQEPPGMYRAATDSTASRVLQALDDPPHEKGIGAQPRNDIKIAVVGDMAQIIATVDREGLDRLEAKLQTLRQLLDD
ncbi:transcriptional regulator [Ponticoccus alexandrii]|uniref:Transcriptional regulator n=1 Tax=Ponticoccus alexandrii TaxID=1943633 RepID=A0ABX7F7K4_9RHOB|nr:transcriptional regulator [Ponticoccus alexandrii]KID12543.1 hypothetical protein P279_27285 [Rhodobacteraceae bacterium PD-2]QRF66358.1 transcriptional regulator [Ponticoccus alexandrii]